MYVIVKPAKRADEFDRYRTDPFGSTSMNPDHAKVYKSKQNCVDIINNDESATGFIVRPTSEFQDFVDMVESLADL